MASVGFDGSPTPRKSMRSSTGFAIFEDSTATDGGVASGATVRPDLPSFKDINARLLQSLSSLSLDQGVKRENSDIPLPLTTSRLLNQLPSPATFNILSKKQKIDSTPSAVEQQPPEFPMDELLAKLQEQQVVLEQQRKALEDRNSDPSTSQWETNTNPYAMSPRSTPSPDCDGMDAAEVLRLKRELEMAKNKIARMDQELSQSRITKHTLEQVMGPQFDGDFDQKSISTQSNTSIWTPATSVIGGPLQGGVKLGTPGMSLSFDSGWSGHAVSNMNGRGGRAMTPHPMLGSIGHQQPPSLRVSTTDTGAFYSSEPSPVDYPRRGGSGQVSRPGSAFGHHVQPWGSSRHGVPDAARMAPPMTAHPYQSMQQPKQQPMPAMHQMNPMQQMVLPPNPASYMPLPGPGGSRMSPTAPEFSFEQQQSGPYGGPGSWTTQAQSEQPAGYLSTTEPMNYRRLLDRNMSCNWKYIVDKIVCSNDQQASIFLQQKLKCATNEQKYEIVQAIIDQAYPLMVNRFGNFLVQRCFEHGTPEQVIAIARAIRGNTLNLSMDAFGCHVVQKAFDCVPEEYKAIMVHELLRRIPETVIHRYACHVWQKLFELRWSDSPPQIMKYVNEALRGMWHEVALGETGSLVVQNIFENCLEEDKRPCINEVLASIDVVAHGQFGNWCIQHICEHGSVPDRTRAIDHVVRFATEYSMDQFASKVVEKCLKIGGPDLLDRYLDRVCEARPDRPRMPLIDIAGDQFGNYLVQHILTHADPQRREIVAAHIRKHMVSLRGSKYGSRVAMLCCNPAFATRLGPGNGMLTRNNSSGYIDRQGYGGNTRAGPYGNSYR